ncbi:MAG: 2OG-Fe(II) oxygenase [Polyangiaceae bacterium]|jgi:hypothetical protein|nr:2OG-Fe(II) oxygenase [Polyangiaceae bacterium]
MYAGHLDLKQPLVWVVEDALTPQQCDAYLERFRSQRREVAPIVGAHGAEINLAVRNNTRIMWDDPAEARSLLERVAHQVPEVLQELRLVGANPRLRIYRYGPGEHHGAHWDTVVEFERGARSQITLVFYLNDGFVGGETEFPELNQTITPRRGAALLFQHRVLHTATGVQYGEKFVLRTDIAFGPEGFEGPLVFVP